MRIAIVTDSTSDIPSDIATALNITIIPTILIINNQQYEDGSEISREEFYTRLPDIKPPPTTSAPSAGIFYKTYHHLLEKENFDQIISIHAASTLSGIYNIACSVAREFSNRVIVIDSGQLSLGLGYQVIRAAEAVKEGVKIEEILYLIEDICKRIKVVAMLDTMENLHRSGRVSWTKASIGSLLRIKPFIELTDGKVISIGQHRTRTKALRHLADLIKNLGPLHQLAMLHTDAAEEAQALLDSLKLSLPTPPLFIFVTPVIGAHVGPRGVGFAAVKID
jgi:DegV family protein with EDD domain